MNSCCVNARVEQNQTNLKNIHLRIRARLKAPLQALTREGDLNFAFKNVVDIDSIYRHDYKTACAAKNLEKFLLVDRTDNSFQHMTNELISTCRFILSAITLNTQTSASHCLMAMVWPSLVCFLR